MALVDVSEVLSDPDIVSDFVVKRRSQSIEQNGRASLDVQTYGPEEGCVGAIYPATPNDLRRLPESQRTEKTMCVVTQFRLQGTSPGFDADLVGWNGSFYTIALLLDYTPYGEGFVQAICTSVDYQDPPPQVNA